MFNFFFEILNLKRHLNCFIGSNVTAILENWGVLTSVGVASGSVCTCSLSDRLVFVTETNFCQRKKFFFVTVTSFCQTKNPAREKISFRIQVFITETSFCPSFRQRNIYGHRRRKQFLPKKKFLSQKKVLSLNLFCLIYQGIVLSSLKGKCVY